MTDVAAAPSLTLRDDDEIDLRALLGTLIEGRWWIVGATLAVFLLGVLYTQVATPIYQVNGLVQVEDTKGSSLGKVGEELGGLFEVKGQATTEMELIRSRMVLGKTVDDLGLDRVARVAQFPFIGRLWLDERTRLDVTRFEVPVTAQGRFFTLEVLDAQRYRLFDPEGERVADGRVNQSLQLSWQGGRLGLFVRDLVGEPGEVFELMQQNRSLAIAGVAERLSLAEKGKQSGIIELTYQHADPALAVRTLNQIANNYVRQNVERKSAEAETTLAFIESQLPEVKSALEAAEVRFNEYRKRTGTVDISKESELLLQQTVQADTGVVALQQQRKELLTRFTAEHPSVQALDNQIAALRGQQNRVSGDIAQLPKTQQELLRLTRDLQVNQEIYTSLLNNAQQLKVVRGGTVGNVRVVDFALPPLQPVKPKKPLVLMLSLLLGGMLGMVLVFVRHALRDGVKDAAQIESRLGLSVLATIPVSRTQDKLFRLLSKEGGERRVLAAQDPEDLSIESLRSLRTSLHFALLDAPSNVIMISGPSPRVGKSFVSVNLAAVMAAAGQRVLLIDADMRRGYLNEYFGAGRDGGLSEVIAGQATSEQAIRASGLEGFDYVATGALPPNPSELLLHPRFEAFLQAMSQRYDQVLVDSPPVIAVTDAAIIGRHAGATLLLARYAHTPLRELEHAARRLQQAGVAVKGVLMNQVAVSTGYGYGYKYAYAYKYAKRQD